MASEVLSPYRADLHVHTVLSACAAVEMIPPLIVRQALAKAIDIIAITDHNASANVKAVQEAASGTPLTVLPGMELQTQEEVHLLCLFDTLSQLESWQMVVDGCLPPLENDADLFGEQFIVDKVGDFVREDTRLLLASAELSFDRAAVKVDQLGGLAIPAHVNRPAYSLLTNLGFVPSHLPVYGFELSRHTDPGTAQSSTPMLRDYCLVQNGDVHRLDEFLGSTEFVIAKPTIDELRLALRRQADRSVRIVAAQG